MDSKVRKYMSEIGSKGGSSKSQKKLDALVLNRAKWSQIALQRAKNKGKDGKAKD